MKRVLSLVLICMMLMSVSVFAADPVTYEPAEDGTYSIGYTEGTADYYYSLVVVEGKYTADQTPTISEESVLYIDQGMADSNGDVTFSGWIPKNDEKATVYLGGTGADSPVLLGYLAAASYTLSGTVTTVPATANEATITLTGLGEEGTYTATTTDGAYTIKVPEGSYTFEVSVDNYIVAEEPINVSGNASKDVTLLGGDVNADGAIGDADITALRANYGTSEAEGDIDGDGTVDYDDLMVVLNNYGKTAVSEEEKTEPIVEYVLEEVSSGKYKVVATLTDTEDDFRGWKNDITYDSTIITPVEGSFVAYSGATVVTETITENGATSKIVYETYVTPGSKDASNVTVFEMQFTLADGKTTDDFTSETFKIDYVAYANGEYNYYGTSDDNVSVVNLVVPSAVIITIPVTAGDIVYFQNGTYATAEATGDYVVLNNVGYVAVNTGKESQKTYYVNGASAVEVHTNGVVAYDEFSIRGPLETYLGEDRKGLRFSKLGHNPLSRTVEDHEVTEVGVLMTTESSKVLGQIGSADNLTWEMVEVYPAYVKYGHAYGDGYDRFLDVETDDMYIFAATMYNIPLSEKNVQTNVVCRPFYKVGDTYIYGETLKATLYDVAESVAASEDFQYYDDEMKAYIEEILSYVEAGTEIEDGDIIIDIGGLYTAQ